MKYIVILLLIFTSLFSNEKQEVTIGVGPYIQSQPYTNVESIILPSPIIFYDNGIFYVRWTRFGVYFLGEKSEDFSWGLSLTAKPRVYGYDSSDISGMDTKENSWEGGLAFSASAGDSYIEIILLNDILGAHNSWILETTLGYDFKVGNFSFYPSITAEYQSKDFINYYYGVTSVEASRRAETVYIADAGLQVGAQTYIKYPFTKNLSGLLNMKLDRLPVQATTSSIVDDKYIYSGLASLIYTFEY